MATRTAVLAVFLAICLTASLFPAGAAGQSASAVGFGEATVVAAQGDVATVDLRVRNTEAVALRVRAADQSYRADINLRDGNGDGRIRVRLDTFRGLDPDTTVDVSTVEPADDAALVSETTTQAGLVFAAGRYNLIAATESTSIAAVLRLESPTAGGNTTRAVPPETALPAAPTEETQAATGVVNRDASTSSTTADGSTTVARGDHARSTFAVSGLGGILERPAPGDDLISAVDAAPSAQTTHRLRASPTEAVRMRSVTIEYGANDVPPTDIYRLSRGDIETLGVDTTGDGAVDRSIQFAVGDIRTSTDGTVTLAFDRAIPLDPGDTLLAAYAVTNPETTGTEPVSVTLAGASVSHTETGVVRYGPAGQGTLGHGVDLQFVSVDTDSRTAPLAGLEYTYDPTRNAVVVNTNTSRLAPGTYAVALSVGSGAPDVLPTTTMRETVRVVEPSVTFRNQTVPDDPLFTVSADTNLAPGNDVVVRVDARERGGGVSQVSNCVTEVTADGDVTCEFDLTKPASDFAIEVSVSRGPNTVGGPVAYT